MFFLLLFRGSAISSSVSIILVHINISRYYQLRRILRCRYQPGESVVELRVSVIASLLPSPIWREKFRFHLALLTQDKIQMCIPRFWLSRGWDLLFCALNVAPDARMQAALLEVCTCFNRWLVMIIAVLSKLFYVIRNSPLLADVGFIVLLHCCSPGRKVQNQHVLTCEIVQPANKSSVLKCNRIKVSAVCQRAVCHLIGDCAVVGKRLAAFDHGFKSAFFAWLCLLHRRSRRHQFQP